MIFPFAWHALLRVWLFFIILHPLVASDPPLARFTQLGLGDGLTDSYITAVIQDRYGYIWIGTRNGLNRFDGHHVVTFLPDPENPENLSHQHVTDLKQDSQGNIWVATLGGGVNRLDPATGKAEQFRTDTVISGSLPANDIKTMYITYDNVLLLGSLENGLIAMDTERNVRSWRHDPKDPTSLRADTILAISPHMGSQFWIGTDHGLELFDIQTGHAIHLGKTNEPSFPLDGFPIRALLTTQGPLTEEQPTPGQTIERLPAEGLLYIGGDKGLASYNPETAQLAILKQDVVVTAIFVSKDGRLWIGTQNRGLFLRTESGHWTEYQNNPSERYTLINNSIRVIAEEASGNLWLGTPDGISRLDIKKKFFDAYIHKPDQPHRIPPSGVKSLVVDAAGHIWMGSQRDGLTRLDRKTGDFVNYRHQLGNPRSLSHNYVQTLLITKDGTLWAGTNDGLNRMNGPGSFQAFHHNPKQPGGLNHSSIFSLLEDREGVLWIGTQEGITHYKNGHFRRVPTAEERKGGMPSGKVYALAEDASGDMWIGLSPTGLVRYDRETDRFVTESDDPRTPVELRENAVRSLATFDNKVWIGTGGGGLLRRDETGSYRGWQNHNSHTIYSILVDDNNGRAWAATHKGLIMIYPNGQSKKFGLFNGLQGERFHQGAAFKSPEGEFFFGGANGFNTFFPSRPRPNAGVPTVAISGVHAEGAEPFYHLSDGSEITLPEGTAKVTFTFAVLDFTRPSLNQYRWYLEGLEDDWHFAVGTGSADYEGLKPGKYTFRVNGADATSNWNIDGTTIKIEVPESFIDEWGPHLWAGGVTILLLLGGMGFLAYRSSHQAHLAELRRKEQVAVEANRSKNAFLAHMSHELRTPLNAILGFSEILEEDIEDYDPELFQPKQFLADLHKIKSNAYLQLTQVNNLLELTRLESGKSELYVEDFEVRTMINSVIHHIDPMLEKTGNRLELIYRPTDIGSMTADSLKLQNILVNLLTNANKFTRDGLISLTVERVGEEIVFSVQDTGVGMSNDKLMHLFEALPMEGMDNTAEGNGLGLYISNQFTKMMGGRILAESMLSRGSLFSVTLPATSTKTT